MSKVTREMIAAAHDVTMRHKIVLGHELLTEIYQAMDAKRELVGLTDEEIKRMAAPWFLSMYWPICNTFAREIETKLRERNT